VLDSAADTAAIPPAKKQSSASQSSSKPADSALRAKAGMSAGGSWGGTLTPIWARDMAPIKTQGPARRLSAIALRGLAAPAPRAGQAFGLTAVPATRVRRGSRVKAGPEGRLAGGKMRSSLDAGGAGPHNAGGARPLALLRA
jgi:hypothetical protein